MLIPKFSKLAPPLVTRDVARAPIAAHEVVGSHDELTLVKQRPLPTFPSRYSEVQKLQRVLARDRGYLQVRDPQGHVTMTMSPPVGDGGASCVFRNALLPDGRVVGVKQMAVRSTLASCAELNPHLPPPVLRDDVEREARVMSACKSMLEVGKPVFVGDEGFLLTKLLRGDAFDTLNIAAATFTPFERQALNRRILHSVAHTLAQLDTAHGMHRDIKLENIFIGPNADVALGDFGAGLERGETELGKDLIGTPGYFAPELVLGCEGTKYDSKVDVYALGVTMLLALLWVDGAPDMLPAFVAEKPTPATERDAMRTLLTWYRERTDGADGALNWARVMQGADEPSTEAAFVDLDRAALVAHDADPDMARYIFDCMLVPDPARRHSPGDVAKCADEMFDHDMESLSAAAMKRHLQFSPKQQQIFRLLRAYALS